jgi:hypothetical protein
VQSVASKSALRVPFIEDCEFFSWRAAKNSALHRNIHPATRVGEFTGWCKPLEITFVQKVSALQESPEANYMLGRIVPAGADAYSRLHMKGALNLPT